MKLVWIVLEHHYVFVSHVSYVTVMFSSLFDLFADAWDNHRDDPNVHIVWFEDLKQVSLTMKVHSVAGGESIEIYYLSSVYVEYKGDHN